MPFVLTFLITLMFGSAAAAQGQETKTYNLNGKDFSFTVQKTPEGKDFGYFVPASRWPSEADGTTNVYVCWENFSPSFPRLNNRTPQALHPIPS